MSSDYERYVAHRKKMADLSYSISVLNWDKEINLPPKSIEHRSRQIATLAGIHHELVTDKEYGALLDKLREKEDLSFKEQRNIELSLKEYEKGCKFPAEFVKEMSLATTDCFQAWIAAKKNNDYSLYEPCLTKLVTLKRKECSIIGYEENMYDALLDEFEPGLTVSQLDPLFAGVRERLVEFVKEIAQCERVDDSFMYLNYPKQKQWDFGIDLLKQMNYSFDHGRQDLSTHPFTTSFGSLDVRVTTRIDENNLNEMIWSTIHEGGHALYEQGLPAADYGLPSGNYLSLGIHESQSRLWENNVGRALPYWKKNIDLIKKYFPANLKNISVETFYKAMNAVKPSLIRTNADELTYHFHVMIRYEIEKELINGEIEVSDLPAVWNKRYKEYLNLDVPSDSEGVLQDIHWSMGSFGYFPTYSLGSFYAVQFYEQAKKEIPNLEIQIQNGELKELLNWLRNKIHKHGRTFSSKELCEKVCGEPLNFNYFMKYAELKYADIYQLTTVRA